MGPPRDPGARQTVGRLFLAGAQVRPTINNKLTVKGRAHSGGACLGARHSADQDKRRNAPAGREDLLRNGRTKSTNVSASANFLRPQKVGSVGRPATGHRLQMEQAARQLGAALAYCAPTPANGPTISGLARPTGRPRWPGAGPTSGRKWRNLEPALARPHTSRAGVGRPAPGAEIQSLAGRPGPAQVYPGAPGWWRSRERWRRVGAKIRRPLVGV